MIEEEDLRPDLRLAEHLCLSLKAIGLDEHLSLPEKMYKQSESKVKVLMWIN